MNKEQNVTYAKPSVAGAIHSAVVGTTLPTDATTKLNKTFKGLGYISEDGLTNENTPETESTKAWGGQTVLITQTSKEDTFSFTLIESLNIDVLKQVYGDENVTGTIESGITIKANAKPLETKSLVIDMILKGGVLKRIVIPKASVTEIGEVKYADEEAVGYETTVQCMPDEEGNTHYEYIVKPNENAAKGV